MKELTLGLLAIMLDEADYVDRWVDGWISSSCTQGDTFDEIVVVDGGSKDATVAKLRGRHPPIRVVERPFKNHFSDQRNFGIESLQTDWIFELDADEILSKPLLAGLRAIMVDAEKAKIDAVGIARLNFLDGVLVASPGDKGLDYQYRLHKRSCLWRGAVHEEITRYRARCEIEIGDGHFIIHDKKNGRHLTRNEYYKTLAP